MNADIGMIQFEAIDPALTRLCGNRGVFAWVQQGTAMLPHDTVALRLPYDNFLDGIVIGSREASANGNALTFEGIWVEGHSGRAGRLVRQPTGYRAFIPADSPPEPPLLIDASLSGHLSRADQAVGRLDGFTHTLPDADMFVAMYVRQEAVLSSQIEGTQSSLDDVLAFELNPHGRDIPQDATEVVNCIRAMNYGLGRLETLPLSLRLIRLEFGQTDLVQSVAAGR